MTERICMNCETPIPQEAVYCPNCGVDVKQFVKDNAKDLLFKKPKKDEALEEPKMSGKAIIIIVVFLILFFPLGIVIGIFEYMDLNKRRKEWRNQRLINAIESKS